ncbi:uncharacterized protein TNCV_3384901 [Trichonephila clavipes]|uniref:Uncharacterized protein n=1 Tax=Trichonephila clavipes TaxID=2585209 RepID=A0A8X6SYV2_TRICX|nr:uncharacterized protein TNCV_3384901 [Trichonephila clavipes]
MAIGQTLIPLSFLLVFVLCTGNYTGCPEYSLLKPCTCVHRPESNVLLCSSIKNSHDLVKVFNSTGNWTFFTLFVHRSNINHIPTASLRSKRFKNILIASSNVDFLFKDDLDTNNDVELIHLNDVFFVQPFQWEWFRPLKKLTYFNLQYSSIPMVNVRILENFSRELGYFLLSNTNTSILEDGVFVNLENLIELKVRNSLIVDLKRTMFPTPAKLQKMDFTGNLIESLPDDLFSNMLELEIVLLEKNRIAYISHSMFGFISHRLGLLSLMEDLLGYPFSPPSLPPERKYQSYHAQSHLSQVTSANDSSIVTTEFSHSAASFSEELNQIQHRKQPEEIVEDVRTLQESWSADGLASMPT